MSNGHKTNSPFWDVQVSIANGVAKMQSPSLAKLHHEILEEMGTPPSQELIDYFLEQVEVADEELVEYYRYIGKYNNKKGISPGASSRPSADLIDTLLQQGNPSVVTFRQAYLKQHGTDPSEQETRNFLERVQKRGRQQVAQPNKQQYFQFAESIARGAHPTVLKLRTDFSKKFGSPPPDEVIKYFLDRIQNGVPEPKSNVQESDAKVNFAKTVANGLISTVLQFRNAYEKVYGEAPSNEIIDVFIKNLSKKPR